MAELDPSDGQIVSIRSPLGAIEGVAKPDDGNRPWVVSMTQISGRQSVDAGDALLLDVSG
jgi:hypothetical protein